MTPLLLRLSVVAALVAVGCAIALVLILGNSLDAKAVPRCSAVWKASSTVYDARRGERPPVPITGGCR